MRFSDDRVHGVYAPLISGGVCPTYFLGPCAGHSSWASGLPILWARSWRRFWCCSQPVSVFMIFSWLILLICVGPFPCDRSGNIFDKFLGRILSSLSASDRLVGIVTNWFCEGNSIKHLVVYERFSGSSVISFCFRVRPTHGVVTNRFCEELNYALVRLILKKINIGIVFFFC